jgi:hypothetical protein
VSNTQKRGDGHYSLDKYKSEAKGEPFVLDIDVDTSIVIPRPTGSVMMDLEEARSSREIIRHLAGEHADALLKVLGPEDYTVMQGVAEDMKKHFGLGE